MATGDKPRWRPNECWPAYTTTTKMGMQIRTRQNYKVTQSSNSAKGARQKRSSVQEDASTGRAFIPDGTWRHRPQSHWRCRPDEDRNQPAADAICQRNDIVDSTCRLKKEKKIGKKEKRGQTERYTLEAASLIAFMLMKWDTRFEIILLHICTRIAAAQDSRKQQKINGKKIWRKSTTAWLEDIWNNGGDRRRIP